MRLREIRRRIPMWLKVREGWLEGLLSMILLAAWLEEEGEL